MNAFQKLTRLRRVRKFSIGDGVQLTPGIRGVVCNVHQNGDTVVYGVRLDNEGYTEHPQAGLTSLPALNQGKYGGPARGGATGGWCGGNHYRNSRKT